MNTPRLEIENLAVFRMVLLGIELAKKHTAPLTAEEIAQELLPAEIETEEGKENYTPLLIDALQASKNIDRAVALFLTKYEPKKPDLDGCNFQKKTGSGGRASCKK